MASYLRHHRAENILYVAAFGFGLLSAAGFVRSYLHTDWSETLPVLPFFVAVTASSCTLTAVALSLLRLFHQDRYPDSVDTPDALGTTGPDAHGSTTVPRRGEAPKHRTH